MNHFQGLSVYIRECPDEFDECMKKEIRVDGNTTEGMPSKALYWQKV